MKIKSGLITPYLIWMTGFIVIPLLVVFYYGFTNDALHFTFDNIMAIASYENMKALGLSFVLSFVSTVICLLIAFPLAYIICNSEIKNKSFIIFLFVLPMWMNSLLRTLAWQTILEEHGIINSFLNVLGLGTIQLINTPFAIVLGMIYNFLPFMILPIYNSLEKIDRDLINAGMDLGANKLMVFRKILIPLAKDGIISGITMVFVPSLTTFVISDLLGGGKILLIGNVIEQEFKLNNHWHIGAGLSIVLMIFIIITMAFSGEQDETGLGL